MKCLHNLGLSCLNILFLALICEMFWYEMKSIGGAIKNAANFILVYSTEANVDDSGIVLKPHYEDVVMKELLLYAPLP